MMPDAACQPMRIRRPPRSSGRIHVLADRHRPVPDPSSPRHPGPSVNAASPAAAANGASRLIAPDGAIRLEGQRCVAGRHWMGQHRADHHSDAGVVSRCIHQGLPALPHCHGRLRQRDRGFGNDGQARALRRPWALLRRHALRVAARAAPDVSPVTGGFAWSASRSSTSAAAAKSPAGLRRGELECAVDTTARAHNRTMPACAPVSQRHAPAYSSADFPRWRTGRGQKLTAPRPKQRGDLDRGRKRHLRIGDAAETAMRRKPVLTACSTSRSTAPETRSSAAAGGKVPHTSRANRIAPPNSARFPST